MGPAGALLRARAVQSPRGPPEEPQMLAARPRPAGPEAEPRAEASRRGVAWPAQERSLRAASCSRTRQSTDSDFASRRSESSSNSGYVGCTQRRWADDRSAAGYRRPKAVHGRSPPYRGGVASTARLQAPNVVVPQRVSLAPRQSRTPNESDHNQGDIKTATKKIIKKIA